MFLDKSGDALDFLKLWRHSIVTKKHFLKQSGLDSNSAVDFQRSPLSVLGFVIHMNLRHVLFFPI